jgi:hypothetical protein
MPSCRSGRFADMFSGHRSWSDEAPIFLTCFLTESPTEGGFTAAYRSWGAPKVRKVWTRIERTRVRTSQAGVAGPNPIGRATNPGVTGVAVAPYHFGPNGADGPLPSRRTHPCQMAPSIWPRPTRGISDGEAVRSGGERRERRRPRQAGAGHPRAMRWTGLARRRRHLRAPAGAGRRRAVPGARAEVLVQAADEVGGRDSRRGSDEMLDREVRCASSEAERLPPAPEQHQ